MGKYSSAHFAWALPAAVIVLAATAFVASARQANPAPHPSQTVDKAASSPPRLPWARGRSFATLDEYLAYLRQYNGPIDLPWWREIRPGVFEKMVSMPGAAQEVVTRAELEGRWGFTRSR